MEGKGLYEEYCDHFPMVQGYREFNYTEWLENELLKLREEVNKNCDTPAVSVNEVKVCDPHETISVRWAHKCVKCGKIFEGQ